MHNAPVGVIDILDEVLLSKGDPFLYHWIVGGGDPLAMQGRVATDCNGKVWFVGPNSISGGGTSSTDVTCKQIKSFLHLEPLKYYIIRMFAFLDPSCTKR